MALEQIKGRMLSIDNASKLTETSISQVHRWIKDGKIKAAKLGYRMTRIDGDSLADFLTSRLDAPIPPRGKHAKPKSGSFVAQSNSPAA